MTKPNNVVLQDAQNLPMRLGIGAVHFEVRLERRARPCGMANEAQVPRWDMMRARSKGRIVYRHMVVSGACCSSGAGADAGALQHYGDLRVRPCRAGRSASTMRTWYRRTRPG
jgi:hypothetical protein